MKVKFEIDHFKIFQTLFQERFVLLNLRFNKEMSERDVRKINHGLL